MFDTPSNLLVCVEGSPNKNKRGIELLPLTNAFALVRLTNSLSNRGKDYQLRTVSSTAFNDLAASPSLLIGGFSNPWALNQLAKLRYHIEQQPGSDLVWIKDEKNPSKHIWFTKPSPTTAPNSTEYAIAARIVTVRNPVIVISGLTANGTAGAADCMLSAGCLEHVFQQVPKNLAAENSENIEAVIAIQMIVGQPGPATILAVEAWKP